MFKELFENLSRVKGLKPSNVYFYKWDGVDNPLNKRSIFSRRDSRERVFSMAMVGRLDELQQGVEVPFYEDGKVSGYVKIPDEIFKLKGASDCTDVWYFGDSTFGSGQRKFAFELRLYGGLEVPGIRVYYGHDSGILEVVVESWSNFVCDPPAGFSIESLIKIITLGSLSKFVFDFGRLNKFQKERLLTVGL